MKDYRLFEITDFVMDEDFTRWVFENRAADQEFWNNWLDQNPDKLLIVAEARRIVESLQIDQLTVSDQQLEADVERLMQTIRTQPRREQKITRRLSISPRWWYAAASVIFITALGAYYFLFETTKNSATDQYKYISQTTSKHLIENINTSGKDAKIILPDGSTVMLAPDSRISYSNSFDSTGTRDVYLSGEAFFNVIRNPDQPFKVFSNEIITKVLGTTFKVRSFEKDSIIQITVTSGKVSVYSQANNTSSKKVSLNKLGGILLTSNQQLVYQKVAQTFQKVISESPAIVVPDILDQKMPYEDVPLEVVFRQLSKAYGIDIVYDGEVLKNCTVTADIRNESFYRQLDLICEAVGARYELMDGQVVIQSNGCH